MAQSIVRKAKSPLSKVCTNVHQKVPQHPVFNVRKVNVTSQKETRMKLQRVSAQPPESIKASGILSGANFRCNQFDSASCHSTRFSDSNPILLTSSRYPIIQKIIPGENGKPTDYVYFMGSAPEDEYALTCHDAFDREALIHKEYRLVLDDEAVREKLVRETEAAQAQQQRLEGNRETHPFHKQFQHVMCSFLNYGTQPSSPVEQPQLNEPGSQCAAGTAALTCGKGYQEDAHLYKQMDMQAPGDTEIFGVLDGHASERCAQNIASHLPQDIENRCKTYSRVMKPKVALWNAGKVGCVDASMKAKNDGAGYNSGTTFCGVLIQGENLTFINSGDSRGIIVNDKRQVIQMTEDAKPGDERYKKSIEKRQGVVIKNSHHDLYRVGGDYASARGLGDGIMAGTTARPKLTECTKETTKIIILATDGLWDVATPQQTGELAQALLDDGYSPQEIASIIAKLALETYRNLAQLYRCNLSKIGDNITVTVILPNQPSAGRS